VGGLLGLGLAYAGTGREDVCEFLLKYLYDTTIETQSMAALALGLVFCGCGNTSAAEELANFLVQPDESLLKAPTLRFFALALGLMFLGTGAECENVMDVVQMMPTELIAYTSVSIETCAYAGTGNMLMVQKYLGVISDCVRKANEKAEAKAAAKAQEEAERAHTGAQQPGATPLPQPSLGQSPLGARLRQAGILRDQPAASPAASQPEEPKEPDEILPAQGVAVLGIALAAMGEEIGDEMVTRALDHVFQYGDPETRRAVPLALALLSVSNPRILIVDTLIRLCHDSDDKVAGAAILSLGLVAAGTKNSRVAGMLQGLAEYHEKKADLLFAVRLAQGLLNLGKGTLTLNPIHSDRTLLCLPAAAGLLVLLHSCLDVQNTILGNMHYLLYSLAITAYPRVLMTVDDTVDMKTLKTPVRVGQAVDIAGQAGRPKAITGFQTHTTPVVIGFSERAELASDDYVPLTQFLEGIVLIRKATEADAYVDEPAAAAAASLSDEVMS